jgi:DNA-binding transcriptional MerR regulator
MTKRRKSEAMGAAQCARHTGLTVRALRVYEKHGLIVPARSAKGWRLYGPKELTRLGTIVTLKAMGLSLAQIREVLTGQAPSLQRVLQLQREVWQTRKDAAEKSLALVDSALGHLHSRKSLSIAELCRLIKSVGAIGDWQATARELFDEMIDPSEVREWVAWSAHRPKEEAGQSRELLESQMLLVRELQGHIDAGARPDDVAVQKLLDRSNRNWLHSGMRERMLQQAQWNSTIARKMYNIGNRLLARTATGGTPPDDGHDFRSFFEAAVRASRWSQVLELVLEDTIAEMTRSTASSPAAQALATRLAQICRRHSLGNPAVYARWITAYAQPRENQSAEHFERRQAAWRFLAEATELTLRRRRGGSRLRPAARRGKHRREE